VELSDGGAGKINGREEGAGILHGASRHALA
jgi:hypothetical protein